MAELKHYNSNSNYVRLVNNPEFIKKIVNNIKIKLGRQLIPTEKNYIIQLLQNVNPSYFNKKSPDEISVIIENKVVQEIKNQNCDQEEIVNIHELLKTEIGIQDGNNILSTNKQIELSSILGTSSLQDFAKTINPIIIRKNTSLILDSRYRTLDTDGTASFKWSVSTATNIAQGTTNAAVDIKNITKIKVLPIRIPYVTQADNSYNRITMSIQEFSAQSTIAHENKRYNFMFEPLIQDRYIELMTRYYNDGVFEFTNPITHLDTLTVSFGSPFDSLIFDPDRINTYIDANGGYSTVTSFTSETNHNIITGDTVYLSNFTTTNINADISIINAINNSTGNIVTKIDNNSFSINVDTSHLQFTGLGTISAVNGSPTITGTNTTFTSLFYVNDTIIFNTNINGYYNDAIYTVAAVVSDTVITLQQLYAEATGTISRYYRNNTINNLSIPVYLGSKRIFIHMEIEYNDDDNTPN